MENNCSKKGTSQTIRILGYIKFGEEKWLKKLFDGEFSFSCVANFIAQAQCTGNESRGDSYEAVFARLLKNDIKIKEFKYKLGNDLEIIEDGEYVLLRRRSACLVPIFCIFGIPDDEDYIEKKGEADGFTEFSFKFPENMYHGFSDNDKFCSLFFQARPFDDAIDTIFQRLNIKKIKKQINYTCRSNNTFIIDINDQYDELFYKLPKYKFQNENRIILPDIKLDSPFERYSVNIPNINVSDKHLFHGRIEMVFRGK